ncbi:MoxR family ATPase [Myxococcota bacterium]|nr:MoxR family ATPase [Myxococcota bacterium]
MAPDGPAWLARVRGEVQKAVIGQDTLIERLLTALLADGHVLLEGMPGLAKTLLIRSLGTAMGFDFERIQFTPDLLPSDLMGTMVFQPHDGQFKAHLGPVFANLVLADEINRAPAKVQSGLLEAMQERQVTLGDESHQLPRPFLVMATQNPIEQEGTYPLPEAQIDRFLFKLICDYPSESEERDMLERWGQLTQQPELEAVSSAGELMALRARVDAVHVSEAVQHYLLALVRETRRRAQNTTEDTQVLSYGASPRASLALLQAGRALAWLRGRDHLSPDLIQELVPDSLRHRLALTYDAEAEEITVDDVLDEILTGTAVPNLVGTPAS